MTNTIDSDSPLFDVPEDDDDEDEDIDLSVFEDYSPIGDRDSALFDVPETESSITDIVPAVDGAKPIRGDDPVEDSAGIGIEIDRELAALESMTAGPQQESAE